MRVQTNPFLRSLTKILQDGLTMSDMVLVSTDTEDTSKQRHKVKRINTYSRTGTIYEDVCSLRP
jgi:hypothetical protein